MRLTTKGRYAVTAVLDLSFHQQAGPVSLADISERQRISLSYLEQLFARLRRNGIVTSTRGPGGGYSLSRTAEEISIAEIIVAVDESYDAPNGAETESCVGQTQCLTHDLWQELSQEIHRFLSAISLAEIRANRSVLEVADRQNKRYKQLHVTSSIRKIAVEPAS